jgi:DNA-binding NtrC family response regulator
MKILIIDDEPDMKPLFEQRLRKEIKAGEIDLIFAENGKTALEKFRCCNRGAGDCSPLVLLDMQLPDISGLCLLQKMIEACPGLKVFIISGMADDETKKKCLDAGAAAFVTKPIDFVKMKELIQQTGG